MYKSSHIISIACWVAWVSFLVGVGVWTASHYLTRSTQSMVYQVEVDAEARRITKSMRDEVMRTHAMYNETILQYEAEITKLNEQVKEMHYKLNGPVGSSNNPGIRIATRTPTTVASFIDVGKQP